MDNAENSSITKYICIKCRVTSEEIDLLAKREKINAEQIQKLHMLSAQIMQKGEIHIYYKLKKENVQLDETKFSDETQYTNETQNLGEKQQGKRFLVAMTLGKKVDEWISSYLELQKLSEAYLADRIAGLVLMNAYDAFRQMVHMKTDCMLGRFHFVGSDGDDRKISDVLSELSQDEITVNEGENMVPAKTVLFEVDLESDETSEQDLHVCASCSNVDCPFRK